MFTVKENFYAEGENLIEMFVIRVYTGKTGIQYVLFFISSIILRIC